MLLATIITLFAIMYIGSLSVAAVTIAQGPAFESSRNHFDLRLGNTLYQAKPVDEAYIPIDLSVAHYFATPLENARIQLDALRSYHV
jgi:hypothetical protein